MAGERARVVPRRRMGAAGTAVVLLLHENAPFHNATQVGIRLEKSICIHFSAYILIHPCCRVA